MADANEKDRAQNAAALPTGPIEPSPVEPRPSPTREVPEHGIEQDQAAEGERNAPPPLREPQAPVAPGRDIAHAGAASTGAERDGDPAPPRSAHGAVAEEAARQGAKPAARSSAPENEPPAAQSGAARPIDPGSADDVLTKKMPGHEAADAAVLAASRQHTRRSFALAAVGAAAGYGFYRWVDHSRDVEMLHTPLRAALRTNAALSRAVFDERALAPTYPVSRSENLRVNGNFGLKENLIPESWRLQLVGMRDAEADPRFKRDVTAWEYRYKAAPTGQDQGHDTKTPPKSDTAAKMAPAPMVGQAEVQENRPKRGREEAGESRSTLPPGTPGLLLTIEDITKLPRRELVTQFKCIEGWSQIVHWAGVRMADFLEAYPPALVQGREPKYVYMETPDGDYYCGYDLRICRHPQTLLVTEMMGAPLTPPHGAPLRLHMPTKYGYKQIKRIGLVAYTDTKPDDYWTKLGYDWYAGL